MNLVPYIYIYIYVGEDFFQGLREVNKFEEIVDGPQILTTRATPQPALYNFGQEENKEAETQSKTKADVLPSSFFD